MATRPLVACRPLEQAAQRRERTADPAAGFVLRRTLFDSTTAVRSARWEEPDAAQ